MRGRAALPWLALAVVLLGVAFVAGAPTGRSDRPLDPRANGPHGAKALVVLLRELGADVEVTRGRPGDSVATAVILRDRLEEAELEGVRRWVEAGGVLVLADPSSALHDAGGAGPCPAALDGVGTIGAEDGGGHLSRGDDCFDGFVTASPMGAGTIVSIGDPAVFTNRFLDDDDNAVLAAALLAPTGPERVAFIQGPAGSGDEALLDLLGPRVAQALGQLTVAFGIYVLWRGRRLGRPVAEPQPVAVAGSELVTAVGRLLGGRRQPVEAAARVRLDVRRALERRLGLPADAPIERVVDAVAARTGLDAAGVVGALATRPVLTDADLVDVVADLDRIRDLALGPPVPAGTHPSGGTP